MKGLLNEFKQFAVRGNAVDLAVAVIIGGAFGKIVTSVVNDLIMPPIGLLIGNVDFSQKRFVLREATDALPAITMNYGVFVNTVLDFTIVAACVFLLVRVVNKMKTAPPAATPTTKVCTECLSSIPLAAKRCAFCASVQTA